VVDYDHLLWGGTKRAAIYSCVLSDGQGLDQVTDALQYGLMAVVGFHTADDANNVRRFAAVNECVLLCHSLFL
jgi:hypothetical protein